MGPVISLIPLSVLLLFATTQAAEQSNETASTTSVSPSLLLELATKIPAPPTVVDEDLSPVWIPNSTDLLVTVRSDLNRRDSPREIRKVDSISGRSVRIVDGQAPVPSPDGTLIACLSSNNDVLVVHLATGNVRQMQVGRGECSYMPLSGAPFAWSPDSQSLIVARVSTSLSIVFPGLQTRLLRVDVGSGKCKEILTKIGMIAHLNWLPDGNTLIFAAQGTDSEAPPNSDEWPQLLKVNLAMQQVSKIDARLPSAAMLAAPAISPDGRYLAFNADPIQQNVTYSTVPTVIELATGAVVLELKDLPCHRWLPSLSWSPDSQRISFACKAGSALMHTVISSDLRGNITRTDMSSLQDIASWSPSPDGMQIAWRSATATGELAVRIAATDGSKERILLDLTPPAIRDLSVGEVRTVSWLAPDGLTIAGLLVRPIKFDPSDKYPLIVDLHGGPQGGIQLAGSLLTATPLEWHYWAAKGYNVFVPDYRSSLVYGMEPLNAMRRSGELEESAYLDIISGVESMIDNGGIDIDRMAVIGHSEGGTKANWLLTRTNRFRAVITKGGGIDYHHDYEQIRHESSMAAKNVEWLFGGAKTSLLDTLQINSALRALNKVTTPVMVITAGENDRKSMQPFLDGLKGNDLLTHLHFDNEQHTIEDSRNIQLLIEQASEFIKLRFDGHRVTSFKPEATGQRQAEFAERGSVTVRDAIEMTRIVSGPLLSPDGQSVAVVIARADIDRNRDTFSLLLLLDAKNGTPVAPRPVVSFTREYNGPDTGSEDEAAITALAFVQGGKKVAFLARHPGRLRQVYEFDRASGAVRQWTDHPTHVREFQFSDDGGTLVYSATELSDDERRRRLGFSILEEKGPKRAQKVARTASLQRKANSGDDDLDEGDPSEHAAVRLFLMTNAAPEPKPMPVWDNLGAAAPYGDMKPMGASLTEPDGYLSSIRAARHFALSPDGRTIAYWPFVPEGEKVALSHYEFYKRTEFKDQLDALISPAVLRTGMPYGLLDLETGETRKLPVGPFDPWAPGAKSRASWSPDSQSVIVNAFLPINTTDNAENTRRAGLPPQLLEVEVTRGTIRPLDMTPGRTGVRWASDGKGFVVREVQNGPLLLTHKSDSWQAAEPIAGADRLNPLRPISTDGQRIAGVRESRNESPEVAVWDAATGELRMLTDLNPSFRERTFAVTERITWSNEQDPEVIGYVTKPLHFTPGTRYPLVILLKDMFAASNLDGPEDDEFLIDGGEQKSGFAIQTLAAHGFVVLHLPFANSFRQTIDGPKEEECIVRHTLSAIDQLERLGLIDPSKVGIAGFSRAGYHANLLLMSKIPFQAGVLIDGGGSSYLESRPWNEEELKRITAPVLIEAHGYEELRLGFTTFFDGLEKLGKPVDLLVFPRGGHNLHSPKHRATSLQTNIDWFRYWLKDEIDPDPAKQNQYIRWQELPKR